MTQKANLPLYICILPTLKKRKLEYFFKNQSVYHVAFMKKSSFNINHTMQIHPSVLRLLSWYDTWYKVHTYLQNIKCQNVMAALRRRIGWANNPVLRNLSVFKMASKKVRRKWFFSFDIRIPLNY